MAHGPIISYDGPAVFDEQYEIICPVGRGRNSVVYQARRLNVADPKQARLLIALKVLVGNAKYPELHVRRMKREALAMLSCVHRNVIKLLDYRSTGDLCYLAMEFAERGDLKQMLDAQQMVFTPELVLRLMAQVLTGLEKIHSVGIIHRDIKPENVLLTRDCTIKLADFGISCLPSETVPPEEANRGIGTFDYLAPECLEEGSSNETTDVYSAAVTCYQLLTGHMPFAGTSFTEQIANKMESRIGSLDQYIKDPPPLLQDLMQKALAADPAMRFHSAADFKAGIERFLAGEWQPDPAFAAVPPLRAAEQTQPPGQSPSAAFSRFRQLVEAGAAAEDETLLDAGPTAEAVTAAHAWADAEHEDELDRIEPGWDESAELYSGRKRAPHDAWAERGTESGGPAPDFGRPAAGRRFSLPRMVFVAFIAALAAFWLFWDGDRFGDWPEGKSGERSGVSSQNLSAEKLDRGLFVLTQRRSSGLVYDLFADGEPVPLVAVPLEDGNKLMVSLAKGGWEPVIIESEELQKSDSLLLVSGGVRLELTRSRDKLPRGTQLSGSFKEHISGREGTWAVW